jgi:cytoskeletal protein CcmA (bactofilin family)
MEEESMKKHNNFTRAVEELMSGKFSTTENGEGGAQDTSSSGQTDAAAKVVDFSPGFDDIRETAAPEAADAFEGEPADRVQAPGEVLPAAHRAEAGSLPMREAIITSDMVIKGTVSAQSNISIEGTIIGDVSSEGDVVVKGRVEGNVVVHSLSIKAGEIVGDILCSGAIIIAEHSSVDGNIKAEHIDVNGKVTGNLESSAKIILNPHSVIEGNVAAAELSMSEGAELHGNVTVRKAK